MFNVDMQNSSKKMNPGKMREALITMFPNRFSIPSETDVTDKPVVIYQKFLGHIHDNDITIPRLTNDEPDKDKIK